LSFTGEFRHTVDSKGRLIVPSRLRDELEDDRVVLARWPDGCVALWAGEGWKDLEERLRQHRRSDANARAAVRAIAASAHQDQVDRQGRITLPQHLRDHAGIDRDVVIVGALDHGEIWGPERWEQEQAKVEDDRLDELVQSLEF
jgi:MraZ protein